MSEVLVIIFTSILKRCENKMNLFHAYQIFIVLSTTGPDSDVF